MNQSYYLEPRTNVLIAFSLQLAQIPEGHSPSPGQPQQQYPGPGLGPGLGLSMGVGDDCEKLCREADQLLDKSRVTEDAHDLATALVLCQAAVGKARQAMDAPYHNPHTLSVARIKHNTCVMRVRSLHRRILQECQTTGKEWHWQSLERAVLLGHFFSGFRYSKGSRRL